MNKLNFQIYGENRIHSVKNLEDGSVIITIKPDQDTWLTINLNKLNKETLLSKIKRE